MHMHTFNWGRKMSLKLNMLPKINLRRKKKKKKKEDGFVN